MNNLRGFLFLIPFTKEYIILCSPLLTLPSLMKGGDSCEEPTDVSLTRKGLAKSPLSGRPKVSGYGE